MQGVTDTAQALDVNLVCFVGGQIKGDSSREFSLYDLILPKKLDGLILAADLSHGVSPEDTRRFCLRFLTIPLVGLSLDVEGIPTIHSDSFNGMRQAISHLVEAHGRSRIAFIQGPAWQFEAKQRYQAYEKALETSGLAFDPLLVVPGDFSPESGRAAVRVLLDERKASLDAIVAANDRMAFGVLEALEERGLQVPTDIALVGFDDVLEAQVLGVPLTTVSQHFYASGQQAVSMVVNQIKGHSIPRQAMMPTELVLRWSCGCLPAAIQQVVCNAPDELPATTSRQPHGLKVLQSHRKAAIDALLGTFSPYTLPGARTPRRQIAATLSDLWGRFLSDLSGETQDNFLKAFAQALTTTQQLPILGNDAALWHSFLSEFRRQVLPYLPDRQVTLRAENLLEQVRILIGEAAQRTQGYQRLAVERQEEKLQGLGHSLATLVSLKDLEDAARLHFPGLGIEHCHIALYDKFEPGMTVRNAQTVQARLLLEYDQGVIECSTNGPSFPARELGPAERLPEGKRYCAIVSPLSFSQSQLGFLWTEVNLRDWEIYIRLGNLLSSAIFRALLIKEREEAMQEIGLLLVHAEQHSVELGTAKDAAEKAAHQAQLALEENASLYDEIKRFNEQLEQMVAQRTEELAQAYRTLEKLDHNKTDFINVAAHELRTPLTVIKGYMGMIDSEAAIRSNPYLSEVVKGVVKGTDRLHMIINSMLDVARIDSQVLDMHTELTSIPVMLKRIQADYHLALSDRRLTLALKNLDQLPLIQADPTLLLKVFQNLIGNAIKYTPDGGEITVSGLATRDEALGEFVEIRVQDRGIGIDPEHHELIFEKFYQTGTVALHSSGETKFKGGGPGLGLSIVRGIVLAHRGRIWVESEGHDEEKYPGSAFHVLLPVG